MEQEFEVPAYAGSRLLTPLADYTGLPLDQVISPDGCILISFEYHLFKQFVGSVDIALMSKFIFYQISCSIGPHKFHRSRHLFFLAKI